LLDDGPRSATVTADEELRCQGIVAWEFAPFVREHPDVAWALLQSLAAMVRKARAG
jgi:CRP-like cAMP-binding protein